MEAGSSAVPRTFGVGVSSERDSAGGGGNSSSSTKFI